MDNFKFLKLCWLANLKGWKVLNIVLADSFKRMEKILLVKNCGQSHSSMYAIFMGFMGPSITQDEHSWAIVFGLCHPWHIPQTPSYHSVSLFTNMVCIGLWGVTGFVLTRPTEICHFFFGGIKLIFLKMPLKALNFL